MWNAAHHQDPWLGRNPEPEIPGRHRSTGLCEGIWQSTSPPVPSQTTPLQHRQQRHRLDRIIPLKQNTESSSGQLRILSGPSAVRSPTRHRLGSPVISNLHQWHLGQPLFNHQTIRRWLPGLLRDQIYHRLWCPPRGPEQTCRVEPHLGHGVFSGKCNILTVMNKVKHQVKYRYRMEGEMVKSASSTPYLGVTVNSKLTWNNHIDRITSSANRLLGFLWRNMHQCPPTLKERAYTAMVRPKLEYCSSVWDPCRQKHVNQLEMVQRRAARFVMNKPHRRQDTTSVTEMVHQLKWHSLQQRRTHSRVMMMYRITKAITDVPAS